MNIREETPADLSVIRQIVDDAFAGAEHSDGTEGQIVEKLRAAGALTLSLVAEEAGQVLGHVAFSPVRIGPQSAGWFGLGPVAVRPDRQAGGIGARLIEAGLAQLRQQGAMGCVVLGDPAYYQRFGFRADPQVQFEGVPPEYFMQLTFDGATPVGAAVYHAAFYPE